MKEYTVHGHKASMFQERFEECKKSEGFFRYNRTPSGVQFSPYLDKSGLFWQLKGLQTKYSVDCHNAMLDDLSFFV